MRKTTYLLSFTALLNAYPASSLAEITVDSNEFFVENNKQVASIMIHNSSSSSAYLNVVASRLVRPGSKNAAYLYYKDPNKLGVFLEPSRLAIRPHSSKRVMLWFLSRSEQQEQLFRVSIRPAIVPRFIAIKQHIVESTSVLNTPSVLVMQLPKQPTARIEFSRNGKSLTATNQGNVSALLFNGKQCLTTTHCTKLPVMRLYPSQTTKVTLRYDEPLSYQIEKYDESVTTQQVP